MVAAAGVPRTAILRTVEEFTQAFHEAVAARQRATIVARVEATGPSKFITDFGLLENRFEFARRLRSQGPRRV